MYRVTNINNYMKNVNMTRNSKTSTLTVTLLNKIERIRRINCYRYQGSSQRNLSPFWFQLLTIFSSFIGKDFYHRQLLVFRIVKIKITIVTPLITSYANLATLKLDTDSSVQTLIDFTRTLLTFRFVIASMRSMVFECLDNFLCFSLSSRTSPL